MSTPIDMTGQVFERLTVVERVRDAKGRLAWRTACSCGREIVLTAGALRCGRYRSCGCWNRERVTLANTRHGAASKRAGVRPEWQAWADAKQRCDNPRNRNFHNYGGRGIRMSDEWAASFEVFFAEVGPRPGPEYSLDRLDTNGHYESGNCRWATDPEQRRNRRDTRLMTLNGRTQCMEDWATELGMDARTLAYRVRARWSDEAALTTPIDLSKSRRQRS